MFDVFDNRYWQPWPVSLSSLPRQEKIDKKTQHKIIQCLKAFMNNKVIFILDVICSVGSSKCLWFNFFNWFLCFVEKKNHNSSLKYISRYIYIKKEVLLGQLNVPFPSVLRQVPIWCQSKIALNKGTTLPHSSKTPQRCIQLLQYIVCWRSFISLHLHTCQMPAFIP